MPSTNTAATAPTDNLRTRAIAYREKELRAETDQQIRGFRGCEEWTAADKREASEARVDCLRRELRLLAALPVDASDADVRRALGV